MIEPLPDICICDELVMFQGHGAIATKCNVCNGVKYSFGTGRSLAELSDREKKFAISQVQRKLGIEPLKTGFDRCEGVLLRGKTEHVCPIRGQCLRYQPPPRDYENTVYITPTVPADAGLHQCGSFIRNVA